MQEFIEQAQPIITTVALVVLTTIAGALGKIAAKAITVAQTKMEIWLDARISESNRELIYKIAQEAFAFAENTYGYLKGDAKLQEAKDYLIRESIKYGIVLTDVQVKAIIEKAVIEFNSNLKQK